MTRARRFFFPYGSLLDRLVLPAAATIATLGVAGLFLPRAAVSGPEVGRAPSRPTYLITSYCDRGLTATGTWTRPGTVAVDPRVIPLGSRLFVPGYGAGRALDTGSAVVGRHVDVWLPSCDAARAWGRRHGAVAVT